MLMKSLYKIADLKGKIKLLSEQIESLYGITVTFGADIKDSPIPSLAILESIKPYHQRMFAVHGLERRVLEGKQYFCIELEGEHGWYYKGNSRDPEVWIDWCDSDRPDEKEDSELTEFLTILLVHDYIVGAQFKRGALRLPIADFERVMAGWRLLPFSAWRYPAYPTRFYAFKGAFAFAAPIESGYRYVCLGSDNSEFIHSLPGGIEWDWDRPKDSGV